MLGGTCVITLFYVQTKNFAMSLRSEFEQRKTEFILAISLVAFAVSIPITLELIPLLQTARPPVALLANVFAANGEASAQSTIYIFAFKPTIGSSIKTIEIAAPTAYDIKGARYIGGSDGFKVSTFEISDSMIKVVLQEPIQLPEGSWGVIEIGNISNPPTPGLYTFTIATTDSAGLVDSGATSIQVAAPTILQSTIQTAHIQDGAITTAKLADQSINLDKLAFDAFSFIDDQFSNMRQQLTEQINEMQSELEASIQSEESARMAADRDESSARVIEDENIRGEIDQLREEIKRIEEEIKLAANRIS